MTQNNDMTTRLLVGMLALSSVLMASCAGSDDLSSSTEVDVMDDSYDVDMAGDSPLASRSDDLSSGQMTDTSDESYDMDMSDAMPEASGGAVSTTTAMFPGATTTMFPGDDADRDVGADVFEDYGVNPPVDPAVDRLSTFALDVDTASYVVARNYLKSDSLPPSEAVRVEEFVNYFEGGYEQAAEAFSISLDAAPQPFADSADVRKVLLRVGIQAPSFADITVPDSVVLVVDRSGSMGEMSGYAGESMPRYMLVHQAVELLLAGLPGTVRVGIVAYSDDAQVVFDPMAIGGNVEQMMQRIRREIVPTNSTNAEAGLRYGYEMALSEAQEGRQVMVLLLSDGVANVGATGTDDILESIGERADIGLSTIGVGLGPFNDALMEQLANKADGTYHYIDTVRQAQRIFVDNLTSLLSEAARDARVQVEFNPEVVATYRLMGFENRDVADEHFRDDTRDAGEVGAGQSSTAIYELELKDSQQSASKIASVTLR